MFKKIVDKTKKKSVLPDMKDEYELYVPAKSTIEGNIVIDGNGVMNGHLKGDITSTKGFLVFGPESKVDGNVSGVEITTYGTITGDISSVGQVTLFAGSKVNGSISAASLVTEKKCYYQGKVMLGSLMDDMKPNRKPINNGQIIQNNDK